MEKLPSLRVVIEAPGGKAYAAQLTAFRLARFLTDKGHAVDVRLVGHGDPREAARRRRAIRAVG
jgi:hypothetical protein